MEKLSTKEVYRNRFMTVTEDELVTDHGDQVTFGLSIKSWARALSSGTVNNSRSLVSIATRWIISPGSSPPATWSTGVSKMRLGQN
jgi:hypothetical protein